MNDELRTSRVLMIQFIIAVILTNLMFFIHEGNYNFLWINNLGNWLAFVLYISVMMLFQWTTYLLIKQLYFGRFQLLLSSLLGVALGLILLFLLLLKT